MTQFQQGESVGEKYTIEEYIGQGSISKVYRAYDGRAGRGVVLKFIEPGAIEDEDSVEVFRRDIKAATALQHKNITSIFGLGWEGDLKFISMEHVDGQRLRDLLDRKIRTNNTFTLKGAYNIVAHICNALEYAHKFTVHGAINPYNIMVTKAGRVKIADFGVGLSALTLSRLPGGLPADRLAYVAPEILQDPNDLGPQVDLYSLGAVLYELLTGVAPLQPVKPLGRLRPDLPPEVDDLVSRAMDRSAKARLADAAAFKATLLDILSRDEGAGEEEDRREASPAPVRKPTVSVHSETVVMSNPSALLSMPLTQPKEAPPARVEASLFGPPRVKDQASLFPPAREEDQASLFPPAREEDQASLFPPPPRPETLKPPPQAETVMAPPPGPPEPAPPPALPVKAKKKKAPKREKEMVLPPPAATASVMEEAKGPSLPAAAGDDTTERWLIQREGMDYGPFSTKGIFEQIGTAKADENSVVKDVDSGIRRKLKDIEEFRGFLKTFLEKRAEEKRREEAKRAARRRTRLRIIKVAIVLIILASGGAGYGVYLYTRPIEVARLQANATKLGVESIQTYSVEPDNPPKPPEEIAAAAAAAAAEGAVGAEGNSNKKGATKGGKGVKRGGKKVASRKPEKDVSNVDFSKEGGGTEKLGQSDIFSVINKNVGRIQSCIVQEQRRNPALVLSTIWLNFTIVAQSGGVTKVSVTGAPSSGLSSCIRSVVYAFRFKKYNGINMPVKFPLKIR